MQATAEEIQCLYQALSSRAEDAWERAWRLWAPRVAGWVRRHPQFGAAGEEVQYFVDRAFERLWRVVDQEKLEHFAAPAQLLQYVKLCVHSAILDELRPGALPIANGSDEGEGLDAVADPGPGVEAIALEGLGRQELWALVASHLQGPAEEIVIRAAFIDGLPPRSIARRHPAVFAGAADVYRIKRNVLERLSRDPRLKIFL